MKTFADICLEREEREICPAEDDFIIKELARRLKRACEQLKTLPTTKDLIGTCVRLAKELEAPMEEK